MANNYAEELGTAVKSIGECPGVSLHAYERNRRNLATLEAWLRSTLEDRAYFECRYESPHRTQPTVWTVVWQQEQHGRVVIGFAEADTEHKARASSAMQAVKAVLENKDRVKALPSLRLGRTRVVPYELLHPECQKEERERNDA